MAREEKRVAGQVLYLLVPGEDSPEMRHMRMVLEMFPGGVPVKMRMADTRKVLQTHCQLHRALIQEAEETLGKESVIVK